MLTDPQDQPLTDSQIRERLTRYFRQMQIVLHPRTLKTRCPDCGVVVYHVKVFTEDGGNRPFSDNGMPHFIDCAIAAPYRRELLFWIEQTELRHKAARIQ